MTEPYPDEMFEEALTPYELQHKKESFEDSPWDAE